MTTPSGHTEAIAASRVIGTSVYNTEGNSIGSIEDVMLDKMSNGIMFAVIGFGGFLGMGTDRYPLPWDQLKYDTTKDGYVVNATWQSGLNMGSTVGAIFGALFNGWATAKYGYKPVAIGGLFFLNAFIFIVFFAPTKAVLLVGQITCGKYCSTRERVSGADRNKV